MFNGTLFPLPIIYFLYNFLITDTSSVTGKDGEHTETTEFDQNSPTTPKEDTTKYRQASNSNPESLAPAGTQVTPSSSTAPAPSSSNSEQDELIIRTKALSLGENTNEAVSNSGTTSEPHQLPKVLKAEKDDLNDPR